MDSDWAAFLGSQDPSVTVESQDWLLMLKGLGDWNSCQLLWGLHGTGFPL